ncbi:PREDICTED: nexilin-like [Camelina sativa]|uniref:Nexilin-like n=1 Tax=Camelina sativa TaxID=90675 RepID=A0ABM0Z4D8_CAMSA|nr:PREDICTED: nexilin-like [Camelina sativa]
MADDNTVTESKKKKTTPSIPANYISILQLQERWINEKEKKRKEEEEKRRKQQQVEEEKKREEEEDLKMEKRLNRSNQGRKNKSTSGGGARFVEKEIAEVTAEVGSGGGGEDTAEMLPKKDRGFRRKRYDSKKNKKKTNQDVALVDDDVVVDSGGCGSIAPTDSVVTENSTPAKDAIRVYRKKSEKATTAVETQFEDLSIKRDENKNHLKAQTKPSNRNRVKQGNDLAHYRVKMPIGAASASTMVWVKKERSNDDGIASGVKPLNAFAPGR